MSCGCKSWSAFGGRRKNKSVKRVRRRKPNKKSRKNKMVGGNYLHDTVNLSLSSSLFNGSSSLGSASPYNA